MIFTFNRLDKSRLSFLVGSVDVAASAYYFSCHFEFVRKNVARKRSETFRVVVIHIRLVSERKNIHHIVKTKGNCVLNGRIPFSCFHSAQKRALLRIT